MEKKNATILRRANVQNRIFSGICVMKLTEMWTNYDNLSLPEGIKRALEYIYKDDTTECR